MFQASSPSKCIPFCDFKRLPFCDLHGPRSSFLLLYYFWFLQCKMMELNYARKCAEVQMFTMHPNNNLVIFVDYRKALWIWDEKSITDPWESVLPRLRYFLFQSSLLLEGTHGNVTTLCCNEFNLFLLNTNIQRHIVLLHIFSKEKDKKHAKVSPAKCPFSNCRLTLLRLFEKDVTMASVALNSISI